MYMQGYQKGMENINLLLNINTLVWVVSLIFFLMCLENGAESIHLSVLEK